jgi:hypothetical protein
MDDERTERESGADIAALFDEIFKYDQPFHSVTLLPIPDPSEEQIQRFGVLLHGDYTNYLELRKLLQKGGFNAFGPLLAEQAVGLSAKLTDAIIPHQIGRLPYKRIIGKTKNYPTT